MSRGMARAGVPFGSAFKIALAADTASIALMELLDNAFVLAVPGAIDAGLTSALFWISLAASLDDLCEGVSCGHETRASMIIL